MNKALEKIYYKSPIFIQNLMTSIYGYKLYRERYVGKHDQYLKELLESQWYSQEGIDNLVNEKFINTLRYAINHVPYYKNLVKDGIIDFNLIKDSSDINKLPILSKELLRENTNLFISDEFEENELIKINTSGTTGKTLRIYVDKNSRRYSYAFYTRLKIWAGINAKSKSITFAGRTIVSPDSNKPPFWRTNPAWNNYLFSSYHLSPDNMRHYVAKIKRIQPYYIDSYPSSIYAIAKYMIDNNINGIHPKAIITSSETLLDSQRNVIEEVFKCPIFDQYGCAEQVVFISQCEKGTYHINPEYGIVELLKDDGTPASPGEQGRLICTGFTNRAMPLFRYDIGDTAVLSEKKCNCGRNYPVIEKIIGRTDDILIMKDGRRVGRLDPVFKGLISIKEAQIIQEDYDNVTLKIVPGKNYNENDARVVISELKKRLGNEVNIRVEIASEIKRTSSGKYRAVITKIRKN